MNFSDFLRNIFGLPDRRQPFNGQGDPKISKFRNPIWNLDEDDDDEEEESIQIFTNPMDMHRLFEQQLDEIVKNFSDGRAFGFPNIFGNSFPRLGPPNDDRSHNDDEDAGKSLREKCLKPNSRTEKYLDTDLDERVIKSGLDSLPSPKTLAPKTFSFFGNSTFSKTIRRPDGSMEHQVTTEDSHGNKKTTITREKDGQRHVITVLVDPSGTEQREESTANINDAHPWKPLSEKPHDWFPYDKLFGNN